MRGFAFFMLLLVLLCAVFFVDGQRKKGSRPGKCGAGPDDKKCKRLIDSKKVCTCPKALGNLGFIREERWFYNKDLRQCDTFSWSTEGGNCNNFATEEECQAACLEQ